MVKRRRKKSTVTTVKTSNGVQIESGIPLPGKAGRGRPAKYPWNDLAVGQSFVMRHIEPVSVKSNVASANRRYKPKHFRHVRLDETSARIWRDK